MRREFNIMIKKEAKRSEQVALFLTVIAVIYYTGHVIVALNKGAF